VDAARVPPFNPPQNGHDMNDIEKSVVRIMDTYCAAVFAKDVETFVRLYDPGVRVFDAWGVWSYEGVESWRRTVEAWFTSLGTELVKVRFDETRIIGGPELISCSAIVEYASLNGEGQRLRAMQNRITWVLRTSGHVSRIVHEHTSAPIGFEDSKAILQRSSPNQPVGHQ
jgi:ketosteroid isomerase-like protein